MCHLKLQAFDFVFRVLCKKMYFSKGFHYSQEFLETMPKLLRPTPPPTFKWEANTCYSLFRLEVWKCFIEYSNAVYWTASCFLVKAQYETATCGIIHLSIKLNNWQQHFRGRCHFYPSYLRSFLTGVDWNWISVLTHENLYVMLLSYGFFPRDQIYVLLNCSKEN